MRGCGCLVSPATLLVALGVVVAAVERSGAALPGAGVAGACSAKGLVVMTEEGVCSAAGLVGALVMRGSVDGLGSSTGAGLGLESDDAPASAMPVCVSAGEMAALVD